MLQRITRRAGIIGLVVVGVLVVSGFVAFAFYFVTTGRYGDQTDVVRVGAVRTGEGQVKILFGACPGETVRGVDLYRTDHNFTTTLGLLWAVNADRPSTPGSFTVGSTPPGFYLVHGLRKPLVPGDKVGVNITSSRVGVIPFDFAVSDLRIGQVLVDHRGTHQSRAEFDAAVQKRCEQR